MPRPQPPPANTQPPNNSLCSDRDGDGHGLGCLNGLDCDDQDPLTHLGAPERCDSIDNDCDRQIDEGTEAGTACVLDLATCERAGVTVCVPGGRPVCEPLVALTEVCNGEDDDCDGRADEGELADGGAPCATGLPGRCGVGALVCLDGAFSCEPTILPASGAEICNGEDDDCDGHIDNVTYGDTDPLTRICYQGPANSREVGLCADGTQTCEPDLGWAPCVGQVLPTLEICDQEDNDCDGAVDDLPGADCTCTPSATRDCYPGPPGTAGVGVCLAGSQTCPPTGFPVWGACGGAVVPTAEVCNNLDDDCDGTVDEGVVGVGVACFSGVGYCRAEGELVCTAGVLSCDFDLIVAETETTCDQIDNDCDGLVDEGPEAVDVAPDPYLGKVGTACESGAGACARVGSIACIGADGEDFTCNVQGAVAGSETCNGIDDDCDATIDEGLGVGNACQVGVGACVRPGVTICGAGGVVTCSAVAGAPLEETCDSLDNDCDGQIDEGLGLGNVCNGTVEGGCGLGVLECGSDGEVKCSTRFGGSDWPMGAYLGVSCTCMDCCEGGVWECTGVGLLCSTAPGGSAFEDPCDP